MNLSDLLPLAKSFESIGLPILSKIVAGLLPPPIGPILEAVVPAIATALGLPPDASPDVIQSTVDANKAEAADKLAALEEQHSDSIKQAELQVQMNMKEAESANFFIAGWRPAFAWMCIAWVFVGLLWTFTGRDLPASFLLIWNPVWIAFGGMLGLRTIEKWGGVARDTLKVILPKKGK